VSRARDRVAGAAGGSLAALVLAGAQAWTMIADIRHDAGAETRATGASCAHVLEYLSSELDECRAALRVCDDAG
jgi:hypothetical protein